MQGQRRTEKTLRNNELLTRDSITGRAKCLLKIRKLCFEEENGLRKWIYCTHGFVQYTTQTEVYLIIQKYSEKSFINPWLKSVSSLDSVCNNCSIYVILPQSPSKLNDED